MEITGIEVMYNTSIAPYTFTKVGGMVDVLAFPKDKAEIQQLIAWCKKKEIEWVVLGNASNIIILDDGFRGMIIMLSKMKSIIVHETTLVAQAGAVLEQVTKVASDHALSGLEFACGIPGSIGGAVYMNAGAYDGEISHVLQSVEVLDSQGQYHVRQKEDLELSYRYSKLQETKDTILSATFALRRGKQKEISERMEYLNTLRREKQPLEYPSCGSVFKRPQGYYTGQLIQAAGLQGKQIGGAQVSTKHAGFIVNVNKATAQDYLQLIAHIKKVIAEKFDVSLETEVRILQELQ